MKIKAKILTIACSAALLSACSTPYINPPVPHYATRETKGGTAAGAVGGVWSGATFTSAGVPILGAAGAVLGFGIGSYTTSTWHQVRTLQKEGVYVLQVGDTLRIILQSDKLFELGTNATINPYYYKTLNHVTNFLTRYGDAPITVTAYTDNVRSVQANKTVSREQAQSVAAYLWSHGIPFDNLHPVGHASNYPVATNGNTMGSYFNRRVELTVPVVPYRHHPQWLGPHKVVKQIYVPYKSPRYHLATAK